MASDGLQLFTSAAHARTRRRVEQYTQRWQPGLPTIEQLADVNYLLAVYDHLRTNGGQAPGVDGIRYEQVGRSEIADALRTVAQAMKNETYVPYPQRLLKIPKGNGKMRQLRLPNIVDRVVGSALQNAVSPYCEGHFHERSYGFRARRGTWTLLADLELDVKRTQCYVLTCDDVKDAFPSVNIDLAMQSFRALIGDPALLRLIEVVLRGANENTVGLSQGCPFSPLALNVVLTFAHDRFVESLNGDTITSPLPGWHRYADNLGYLCRSVLEGRQVLNNVNQHLQQLGFQLKGEPDAPVDLREGTVEVLGFQIAVVKDQMQYTPGSKAWKHLADHLVQAHDTPCPSQAARKVIEGSIRSLGPVFENHTDDLFLSQIQEIARHHGFRETQDRKTLKHLTQEAGRQWREDRRRCHERDGVKGDRGVEEDSRSKEKKVAPRTTTAGSNSLSATVPHVRAV